MKKTIIGALLLLLLLAVMCCQGCILCSDASYATKTAMWQAKAEASKAWAANANKPLATFTAASGETFVVNNPIQAQPMPVVGEPNAIVQVVDKALNSAGLKFITGGIAFKLATDNMQGNFRADNGASIDVTRDSGNTVDVETNHAEDGTISDETHTGSDYVTTDNSATATPTVVNQPDPVIVQTPDPVIVQTPDPVVVNPEVVVVGGGE